MDPKGQGSFFQGDFEMNGIGGAGNQLGKRDDLDAVELGHQLFGLFQIIRGCNLAVWVGEGDPVLLGAAVKGQGVGHGRLDQSGVDPVAAGLDQFQMVGKDNGSAALDVIEHLLGKPVFHGSEEQKIRVRGGDDYIFDFRMLFAVGQRLPGAGEQQETAQKDNLYI